MDSLHGRLGVMCTLAWALLAGVGCSGGGPGAANVDNASCKTADDCMYVPPCAERAICDGGICRYEAKRCDTPPAPECLSGDTVYRVYLAPGTCQQDGTCNYAVSDMSCAGCATQCLGTCKGMSCDDLQHGCRTAGRCVPGTSATCSYDSSAAQGCDDGDLCTYSDHCDGAGHCVANTVSCVSDPGTCAKHRKCNGTATCDEWFPGADAGCDDGSPATYGDHCDGAGKCVGTGVTCADDAGTCGARRTANGTATCAVSYPGTSVACDDGNASTSGDHCDGAGKCVTGSSVACTDDAGPCGAHRTANGTATCTVSYPGLSVTCNDGKVSTYGDHCDGAGACVGTPVICSSDPAPCGAQRTANGTAACTVSYPGTSVTCNDGSDSTYGDHCNGAGACVGTAMTCSSDPGPCGALRTPNGTASCAVSYPSTSVTCNDNNLSTYGDHCNGAGSCVGTTVTCSSDPGPCGVQRSPNGTSTCTVTTPSSSTSCDDGNTCTVGDHCDGAGHCLSGSGSQTEGNACDVVFPGTAGGCKSCKSGACTTGCGPGTSCQLVQGSAPYVCH